MQALEALRVNLKTAAHELMSAGAAQLPPGRLQATRPSVVSGIMQHRPTLDDHGWRAYTRRVIPKEKVAQLVDAHDKLEERTTGAIWIRQDAGEAWLVEVIPSMADDEKADEPTFFSPGVEFRFPLALIAGNRASLEKALQRRPDLARDVAKGEIVLDHGDAKSLVDFARDVSRAA